MADWLRDWHDFYLLIGTASATLIGLMFVAASVGANFFNAEREAALRAFLTPTVLHFSAVLTTCLLATAPANHGHFLSAFLIAGGIAGIGYSCRLGIRMRTRGIVNSIDWIDRSCYIFLPIVCYFLLTVAATVLFDRRDWAPDLLALTLILLLGLGIRNAWDMTLWVVIQTPNR
jgi:hypothetical protein